MVKQKLRIGVGISLIVAGSVATPSNASDHTQCHDLPAKQTVLDEGKELLRQQGNSSWARTNLHNLPPESRYWADEYPSSYFDPRFDYSNEPVTDIHKTLPVQTLIELRSALETADTLERYFRGNSANILFTRILSSARFSKLEPEDQAAVLEGAARTKIEWGLKKETESPDSFRDRIFSTDHLYFSAMAYLTPIRLRHFVLDATTRTSLPKEDFELLKELYTRAASIRSKLKPTDELSTDLLMLGALSEKTNELSDAAKYFFQAMELMQKTSKTKIITANTDAESAPGNEEENYLTHDALTVIVSAQIRANLADGKNYQPLRAVKLFEEKCLNQPPENKIIVSLQSLLSVLDVLPSRDLPAFVDYLRTIIHDRNQSTIMATNFPAIMQKMTARGWGTECNTVCEYAISQSDIDNLFMIAKWYSVSKDDAHLINTAKMILLSIQNDSDEQALSSLKLLMTLLTTASTNQPELSNVKSETVRITAYHEDQIRRKQCLHMADSLNQTAFALELKAQPAMATKLYKEALEIKQMNLKSNDPSTATQLVDLARSEAAQRQFEEAQVHFEKALAVMRKNPLMDPSDTVSALESYGMMLNDWNHGAKATQVYEEAKALHNKISKPKVFAR